ncbi:MAG: aquaporin [Rhodoluna sp.]|jgi:glycerol uptake facilitator-like aquaporin|nr:aquaporin [Rhodoluna sp.]
MNYKAIFAEFLGTGLLVAAVIGSGIMASNLSGDLLVALIANGISTVLVLGILILTLGPVSGGHFNPVVSIALAIDQRFKAVRVAPYIAAQFAGAFAGAVLANVMFGSAAIQVSSKGMVSEGAAIGEVVATAGLVFIILNLIKSKRAELIPVAVPAWIGTAYFFTSSTSFANPAATVGRIFSDSFAGIGPQSVPSFVIAQLLGAALGIVLAKVFAKSKK